MKKVLIAEDEAFNRIVLQDMLELIYPGSAVKIVENGQEALRIISEGWPDVVLSDIDMPQMSGVELVKAVRNDLKSAVPMVCITAFAITGDRESLLMQGYDAYVSKPIEIAELENTLDPFMK